MAQTDLEPDLVVQEGARWLVETPKEQRPRPAVVELRARFPLSTHDAIAAIRLADQVRGCADASGS